MLLEAQHIEKSFGAYRALDDVNIAVREGTIFGLLGPNGAGKTTFIRLVNRISRPDKGELLLNGRAMSDDDVRQIGYLPEERGLYKKMKVGEQAIYLAQLKGLTRSEAHRRLLRWFERFGIADWWNRSVEELSKGMQQKVQFIVTVLHEPKLLIFDEPFSGFDPVNATLLKNEILQLRKQGATVILSTHNMASVEELCDDIALINKAKVVLHGGVSDIRKSYRQNRFEVVLAAAENKVILPDGYEVSGRESKPGEEYLQVALPEGVGSNELLALLLPQRQVLALREILPTMNDIFIRTVER